VSLGGRSFDLGSVDRDPTVDTDGNGAVDAADLLAQLNAAAQRALGLSRPPFSAPTAGTLRFAVADAVPGATGTAGSALGGSAADLARATPSFTPATGASRALDSIDAAIERVSTVRADIGAVQNRLEHNVARLGVALDNTAASESRIVDTDMAAEMTAFGRAQILTQASTAMLAQANASPQAVLKLLA
jgi:flagellin